MKQTRHRFLRQTAPISLSMKTAVLTLFMTALACCAVAGEEWKGQAAFGLNMTSGNSDTLMLNSDIKLEYKGKENEFKATALFAYGETDDDTTEKNGKTSAKYSRLLNKRAFLYFNSDATYDEIAKLDYRWTAGPGLGCYLLKRESQSFKIELGSAYIAEQFETDNGNDTDDRITLRSLQRFDCNISETAKAWESAEYLPEISDWDNYLLNIEIGIETKINSNFSLRLTALNKYDSEPAPGVKESDTVIKAALVLKLN